MLKGVDTMLDGRTVVGDPIKVGEAVVIPLMDVSCGMAAGTFGDNAKGTGAGGMSTKISTTAVLIIQNGVTKLINVKNQDAISKLVDIIPDVVNKLTADKKIAPEAVETAKQVIASEEKEQ